MPRTKQKVDNSTRRSSLDSLSSEKSLNQLNMLAGKPLTSSTPIDVNNPGLRKTSTSQKRKIKEVVKEKGYFVVLFLNHFLFTCPFS